MWTQADFVARKVLIERALGVSSGEFLLEGGWQDWPVIDMFRGVKPGALTLEVAATMTRGRAFLGFGSTGQKHGLWSLRFRGMSALWSSGAPVRVGLACAVTVADAFGAQSVVRGNWLTAGSSPSYVVHGTGCLRGA
jgi:hypothetical protein